MGFRYHKSVSIAKGVRVNFSGSGPSISFGGRGLRLNLGAKGARVTTGIPGTGVSYTKSIGTKQILDVVSSLTGLNLGGEDAFNGTGCSGRSRAAAVPEQLEFSLSELGQLVVTGADGREITDKTLLRRIRATEPYRTQIAELESQRASILQERVQEAEEENERFINVVSLSPIVETRTAFERRLEQVRARSGPEREINYLQSLIAGDEEAVSEEFNAWISSVELPVEININYDWDARTGTMLLDVDLPEIEDLPDHHLERTESGTLKEKKKTQTELRAEYARLVFGLAVLLTANTFNLSPAVERVLISGFTQREDSEGYIHDTYIYSLKFKRAMFERRNVAGQEPQKLCLSAENRCSMTSTGLLREITPFATFDEA